MAEDDPGGEPGAEWLTISAAARRLGITPRSIRGRIQRGTIEWKPHGNSGRLVRVTGADEPQGGPGADDPQDELVDELRAELTAALVAQARAEAQVEAKDMVIAELRADLAWHRQPWWWRLLIKSRDPT